MANWKATFIFEQGPKGWTESYHTAEESVSLNNVFSWALILGSVRANLLGRESTLKAIRVSSEDVLNDGQLRYVNLKGLPMGGGAAPVPHSDDADTAIQVRLENLSGARHKLVFLRGIWDDLNIEGGKLKKTDVEFQKRFKEYADEVKRRWGWYGVSDAAKRQQVITGYTVDDAGIVSLQLGGNLFQPGEIGIDKFSKVRISRLNKSQSELKGEIIVNPTAANAAKTVESYGLLPFSSNGRIVISEYRVWEAKEVVMQKIVTRRSGAPLLESRGRAKKRARG